MRKLKIIICGGAGEVEYLIVKDGVICHRFTIDQEDPYSDMVEVFKAAGIRDVEYEDII